MEASLPGGSGSNVWALVASFSNTNNYRPVNLGQLKYVAQPFYDRLIEVGYTTSYPWSDSINPPNDYALANIGQAKNVFSFDLRLDSDGDGIPDWWELLYGLNPHDPDDAYQEFPNPWTHGLSYLEVYQNPSLLIAEDYCSVLGRRLTPEDNEIPDWWKRWYGYSVNTLTSTVGANGLTLLASCQGSLDPTIPVSVILDQFNYAQVNLLRWASGLAPVEWARSASNEVRITQLRDSIGAIATNCLDFSVNPGGGLANTNVVVRWTLATVLNAVSNITGNTTGNWLSGPPSLFQVNELKEVLGQLTCLPVESDLQAGVTNAPSSTNQPLPYVIGAWEVTLPYPPAWPTNWTICTYVQFTTLREESPQCWLDDYVTVNVTNDPFWAWANNVVITSRWLPNQANQIQAWDEIAGQFYCSPFRIVHVLEVPTVNVKFQVKEGKVNHGWDPTGTEPWTSVGVGRTNQIVQLVINGTISPSDVVLVSSTPDKVTVSPTNNLDAQTDLTIIGLAAITNASIEARLRGSTNTLATLHVMALEWQTLSIGVYAITDGMSMATAPVEFSTDAILTNLNDAFQQACIDFVLTNSFTTNIVYDVYHWTENGTLESRQDGDFQAEEKTPIQFLNSSLWSGKARVFLFKSCGERKLVRGYTPSQGADYSVVYTSNAAERVSLTVAHEVGHQLKLSTRDDDPKNPHHDLGTPPSGTGTLMRPRIFIPPEEPRWIRREDWKKANDSTYDKLHPSP